MGAGMALIADILMVAGALGAAAYCMVLARRLRRFNDLEKGMGGAIAVLSAQVDDMTRALTGAQTSAKASSGTLVDLTSRAEGVAQRLELLVASLHDLPMEDAVVPPKEVKSASEAAVSDAPNEVAPLSFLSSRDKAKAPPLVFRRESEGVQ